MDIRSTLLQQHSRKNADKIALFVGSSSFRFKQLINVYLAGPYRITQRAAWPLSICAENHPALLHGHLRKILKHLDQPNLPDAVKRNTLRLLQFVEIPTRHQGRVIQLCFNYLLGKNEPVAVKVFAMTVLSRLVSHMPELRRELRIIIEDQLPFGSAGFSSRAIKVLKILKD